MNIESNLSQVFNDIRLRFEKLESPDGMLREVATTMQAIVHDRIHTEGKDASGSDIGTYSEEYMSVRTGQYKTNGTVTKGKNKGEIRKEGVYTRGINKGKPRINYNRTGDTKVIASLTRQMESDFAVVATENGYGLGFNNPENFKKSQYVENTYKKKIWSLTDPEKERAIEVAIDYTNSELNG